MKSITVKENEENKIENLFNNSPGLEKLNEQTLLARNKIILNIEFIGGYFSGSLAIMTDAAHLLSDFGGFLLSIAALHLAQKAPTKEFTYGFHRLEVLGSLVSITFIWIITFFLIYEAIQRLSKPKQIDGKTMMIISSIGLVFNIIMSIILSYSPVPNGFENSLSKNKKENTKSNKEENIKNIENNNNQIENKKENIKNDEENEDAPLLKSNNNLIETQNNNDNNKIQVISKENNNKKIFKADKNPVVRAAFIHIIGDLIQSVGVLTAATIIYFFQNKNPKVLIADPICTFIFAIIILCTTIPVSISCFCILMESIPDDINISDIFDELSKAEGLIKIYDIHLWCISIGKTCISLHATSDNKINTLKKFIEICRNKGIYHFTFQIEDLEEHKNICEKILRDDN